MRRFDPSNWRFSPFNRESFQDVQSLFPTARIRRGDAGTTPLPTSFRELGAIEFPRATGEVGTISQLIEAPESDAFLILKNGELLGETYRNGMAPDTPHLVNSISKSFLGALAGILVADGVVDPQRSVTSYLPELDPRAFPRTTVSDLLNMTAAVKFGEDYDDQADDFWVETSVVGWRPELASLTAARSLRDYAQARTETQQEDAAAFGYRTLLTNVLAMVLESAADRPVRDLFEEGLWQPLGCEQDCAIVVDATGFPYFGAGMNVCARDLARFGLLLLGDGACGGRRILPEGWVRQTLAGTDHLRSLFAATPAAELIPGGHYANQFWANSERGVLFCIGIHGQLILTDTRTGVVIVKLSSHPKPADPMFFADAVSALLALSEALA